MSNRCARHTEAESGIISSGTALLLATGIRVRQLLYRASPSDLSYSDLHSCLKKETKNCDISEVEELHHISKGSGGQGLA